MEYNTLRIWKSTLKKLRHIYAETGESMIAIVDRLADQELQRLSNDSDPHLQVQTVPSQKE